MMEKTKNNKVLGIAVIGLKLLLICAVIAGIVSFVYDLTLEKYEANIQETKIRPSVRFLVKKDWIAKRLPRAFIP